MQGIIVCEYYLLGVIGIEFNDLQMLLGKDIVQFYSYFISLLAGQ